MAKTNEDRPLAELLGSLATDISTLLRKEIQLAKAEASEKASDAVAGTFSILIGAVLALGALGVLLSALVLLVAAFLANQGMDPIMANAVAAGLVALVVGIIAWIFIARGRSAISASNLNMNRTAASLGRDADIVKERL
jgi:hypothetical protein